MNWIEVIDIRSTEIRKQEFKKILRKPLIQKETKEGLMELILYHNASVETDFSIHLQWKTEKKVVGKSSLGLQLVSALESFGRANHTIWIQEKGENNEN